MTKALTWAGIPVSVIGNRRGAYLGGRKITCESAWMRGLLQMQLEW